jgi:deazaflavin-dependent oxidoreductase (nitroreductase family)
MVTRWDGLARSPQWANDVAPVSAILGPVASRRRRGSCLLSVRGRVSGQWRSTPVVVLDHARQRYLLAAYGDTEWSRNLRTAGGGRLTQRGRVEEFQATEVPLEQRPPLIEAYRRQFGKLPTVGRTLRALSDPADHPTFRITSGSDSGTRRTIDLPA